MHGKEQARQIDELYNGVSMIRLQTAVMVGNNGQRNMH